MLKTILFSSALFLSAFLIFLIQPMVAKALLPYFGGTPGVWTVCLLFFQIALLMGYTYAWAMTRIKPNHLGKILHCILAAVGCLSLPTVFLFIKNPELNPQWNLLLFLSVQLGWPLLILSASAPLLQAVYSQGEGIDARDPYFLYAASNAGSLAALVLYPLIFEYWLGLGWLFKLWSLGYVLFAGLLGILFLYPVKRLTPDKTLVKRQMLFYWCALSFISCSLLMSVTAYITTDLASIPLLWILPLILYLLSFILTFAKNSDNLTGKITKFAGYALLLPLPGLLWGENHFPAWILVLVNLGAFFLFCFYCHRELKHSRPETAQLTVYYWFIALGGVVAGILNGLLAPVWFKGSWEYPLSLFFFLMIYPFYGKQQKLKSPVLLSVGIGLAGFAWWFNQVDVLNIERNFYGVKQVKSLDTTHYLLHQTTLHGFQWREEPKPLNGYRSYYGVLKPVIAAVSKTAPQGLEATVIGLGTGMMACQYKSKDHVHFIEIDPQVIAIARNPDWFSFLRDCHSNLEVLEGDGRLTLQSFKPFSQDLIVMDAFSSDAVPMHLLTQEAMNLYREKLKPEGLLIFNLSNRHLQLLPVITAYGRGEDLIVLHKKDSGDPAQGQLASEWGILTQNRTIAGQLMREGWQFVAGNQEISWTDDYSNFLGVIRYG